MDACVPPSQTSKHGKKKKSGRPPPPKGRRIWCFYRGGMLHDVLVDKKNLATTKKRAQLAASPLLIATGVAVPAVPIR